MIAADHEDECRLTCAVVGSSMRGLRPRSSRLAPGRECSSRGAEPTGRRAHIVDDAVHANVEPRGAENRLGRAPLLRGCLLCGHADVVVCCPQARLGELESGPALPSSRPSRR